MKRRARAYAPGHVTGVFRSASTGRDPRRAGSVGAGLVLELGAVAEVEWDPSARRHLAVRSPTGEPLSITTEALDHLRGSRPGSLRATVHPALPVGQGFGMSAAGTLASSIAAASLIDLPLGRATETAHLAELFGRGGLGGVAAILGGGLELRLRPGVPPFGEVRHLSWDPASVFLVRVGDPIPSPLILGSPRWLERIDRAAEGLEDLLGHPSREGFLDMSERFTDRLALGSSEFHRVVRALRRTGCWAAQAMFGNALFVIPRSQAARRRLLRVLTDLEMPAVETKASRRGARLLLPRAGKAFGIVPKDFRGGTVRRTP